MTFAQLTFRVHSCMHDLPGTFCLSCSSSENGMVAVAGVYGGSPSEVDNQCMLRYAAASLCNARQRSAEAQGRIDGVDQRLTAMYDALVKRDKCIGRGVLDLPTPQPQPVHGMCLHNLAVVAQLITGRCLIDLCGLLWHQPPSHGPSLFTCSALKC